MSSSLATAEPSSMAVPLRGAWAAPEDPSSGKGPCWGWCQRRGLLSALATSRDIIRQCIFLNDCLGNLPHFMMPPCTMMNTECVLFKASPILFHPFFFVFWWALLPGDIRWQDTRLASGEKAIPQPSLPLYPAASGVGGGGGGAKGDGREDDITLPSAQQSAESFLCTCGRRMWKRRRQWRLSLTPLLLPHSSARLRPPYFGLLWHLIV